MNDHDDTDNEPIGYDRKAEEREAHGDWLRDELRDRQMEEERLELVAHAAKAALNTLQADMDRLKQKLAVQIHENATLRDRITELEETSISWFIAAQETGNALRDLVDSLCSIDGYTPPVTQRAIKALQELKKHPDSLTIRKLYAVILPDGRIIAESHFEDEKKAWTVALGWPSPDEIEHAKQNGARCVLASLVYQTEP